MYMVHEILPKNTVLLFLVILAYRAVMPDGGFMRGWKGAFSQQNCLHADRLCTADL